MQAARSELRTALLPLASVETQSICIGLESDLTSLGKVKHISWHSMDFLARLIRNIKLSLNDDLHLVVGIFVN